MQHLPEPSFSGENRASGILEALRLAAPETVRDGRVDLNTLSGLLGGAVESGEERYGLNWHGKHRARNLALQPSLGTLRPAPDESVDWDETQNLLIEGDNLETLKILQKSYAGKIKLICIDPPYNTGKDFIYPDDYTDGIKNYLATSRQLLDGGKISSNVETQGRFHTQWLNMMYPRLKLARTLLRNDGVITVQIDDNEIHNVRSLLDEIFGSENFVNIIAVKMSHLSGVKMSHADQKFPKIKEYVVVYARNRGLMTMKGPEEACSWDEAFKRYTQVLLNPAEPIEKWETATLKSVTAGMSPEEVGAWRLENSDRIFRTATNDSLAATPKDGVFRRIRTATGLERLAFNQEEVLFARSRMRQIEGKWTPITKMGDLWTDIGINNLHKEGDVPFPNGKKPLKLIRRILEAFTAPDEEAWVLDFFAGSGTLGHACFLQNQQDGGRRKFILVQFPEPLAEEQGPEGTEASKGTRPRHIAQLTAERIRGAGKKIRTENADRNLDCGFRVFKLDTSNLRPWISETPDLAAHLLEHENHILPDRSGLDLLFEVMLRIGIEISSPLESRTIAGKMVRCIDKGRLFACLGPALNLDEVRPLVEGIIAWRDELKPEVKSRCVFLDSALDEVSKANLEALLLQVGFLKDHILSV